MRIGHFEDRFSVRTPWALVMVFAIAMACVEAASVFYIRALVDRIEPYQTSPLPLQEALANVELWREAATLVMIATLGMLAGRTWRRPAYGRWFLVVATMQLSNGLPWRSM
jgi:hypothetical protein